MSAGAMPGFTFGAPSAASTPVPGGTAPLFGAPAAKPLFGATPTTTASTKPPTLFGTPASTAPATGGLFGAATPAASTATAGTTGGLFGSTTPAVSTAAAPAFGSSPAKGLFGATPATSTAATAGGLFGKPAGGGLFGATSTTITPATSTPGGIFGSAPSGGTGIPSTGGLGGTSTLTVGGSTAGTGTSNGVGVTGAAANTNPMDGEVPKQIVDLIEQLKEQIRKNREMSDEFAMNSNDACMSMHDKMDEVKKILVKDTADVRRVRLKANGLVDKVERDVRASEQLQRRQKEMAKAPRYGTNHAMDYLQAACSDYETIVTEMDATLQRVEGVVASKLKQDRSKEMAKAPRYGTNHAMDYLQAACSDYETIVTEMDATLQRVEGVVASKLKQDRSKPQVTHADLMSHLKRFDQVFKVIASDVYQANQQVQETKEAFAEYRRRTMPYAPNPFDRKLDTVQNAVAFSKYTGAEAFPSQATMMKIGELARAGAPAQQTATPGFGTTGSLFGSKPLGTTPFSFTTPTSSVTPAPLFKPFSTPATSTTTPLFGSTVTSTAGAPPAAPTSSASFTFGNTLNSSTSGTLFSSSASKPLFGK